jgi:3-oxoadipate enol-lactonase
MIDFQLTRWFTDKFPAAHPELVAAATRVFLANDLDCYAASCVMLGDADLRPYLPSLRVPVAVLVGEEDYATPVAMSRYLHESIPDSTLTILPGRHLTGIECPDQIASELFALIQRAKSAHA